MLEVVGHQSGVPVARQARAIEVLGGRFTPGKSGADSSRSSRGGSTLDGVGERGRQFRQWPAGLGRRGSGAETASREIPVASGDLLPPGRHPVGDGSSQSRGSRYFVGSNAKRPLRDRPSAGRYLRLLARQLQLLRSPGSARPRRSPGPWPAWSGSCGAIFLLEPLPLVYGERRRGSPRRRFRSHRTGRCPRIGRMRFRLTVYVSLVPSATSTRDASQRSPPRPSASVQRPSRPR